MIYISAIRTSTSAYHYYYHRKWNFKIVKMSANLHWIICFFKFFWLYATRLPVIIFYHLPQNFEKKLTIYTVKFIQTLRELIKAVNMSRPKRRRANFDGTIWLVKIWIFITISFYKQYDKAIISFNFFCILWRRVLFILKNVCVKVFTKQMSQRDAWAAPF